jgi:hypothetical protein
MLGCFERYSTGPVTAGDVLQPAELGAAAKPAADPASRERCPS